MFRKVRRFDDCGAPRCAQHRLAHRRLHFDMVASLAINDAADLGFALGDDDMDLDRLLLSEPPTPPHGLIPCLIGVAATDKSHVVAMRPIQSESTHGWLCY